MFWTNFIKSVDTAANTGSFYRPVQCGSPISAKGNSDTGVSNVCRVYIVYVYLFSFFCCRWKFFSYVSRDCESLMECLKTVVGVVVGFIHRNQLYPVRIESPTLSGNWAQTINTLQYHGLNVVFRNDPIPTNAKNVYFVKQDLKNIYRLDTSLLELTAGCTNHNVWNVS